MIAAGKKLLSRRIAVYEAAGFAAVILLIWLDELADVPALLLGALETPVNWRESLFESVIIVLLCVAVIHLANTLFRRRIKSRRAAADLRLLPQDQNRERRLAVGGGISS